MTSTNDVRHHLVTPEMRAQYEKEGYFVLERVLTAEQLELLRSGAQYSIDKLDAAMDEAGVDRIGINARGKRYFSNMIYKDRPEAAAVPLQRHDGGRSAGRRSARTRTCSGSST